jgi:glutamyl-tRNA reductase
MAKLFQGTPVEYSRFISMLPEVDILITSSGAPHYILHKEEMHRVIAARRNKPMFLIDIAVPRNIEPSVNDLDNVFLYDIDDLQEVVNANLRERMKEADHAEAVVTEEVDRMMARLKIAEVTPLIVGLQEQLEQIRSGEIDKVRRKFGPFTAEQEQAIDALTRGIINKIAHGPISELRNHAGQPEGVHVVAAIRKAFHLQG